MPDRNLTWPGCQKTAGHKHIRTSVHRPLVGGQSGMRSVTIAVEPHYPIGGMSAQVIKQLRHRAEPFRTRR